MSSIPVEILAHIFHYLFWTPIDVDCMESSGIPWEVGEVCQHWRDVFLTTSSFWASVSLTADSDTNNAQLAAKAYRLLAMCLKNSEEHPLDVTIVIVKQEDDYMTPAVRLLLSQSYRWKSAILCLESAQHIAEILTRERVPILESITLITDHVDPPDLGAFEIVPCLTHASLQYYEKFHGWVLPWSQLTKLEVSFSGLNVGTRHDLPVDVAFGFLYQLTYIEELCMSVDTVIDSYPDNLNAPKARLKFLRQLDVDLPFLLSLIEAPLLRNLHLSNYFRTSTCSYSQELHSLIDRSRCQIRQLSLYGPNHIDVEGVVSLLVDIEELELFISGWRFYQNGPIVVFPPDGLRLLPKLRVIRFSFETDTPSDILAEAIPQLLEPLGIQPREEHNASAILPLEQLIIDFSASHTGDFIITELPKRLLVAVAKYPSSLQLVIRVVVNGRVVFSVNLSKVLEMEKERYCFHIDK